MRNEASLKEDKGRGRGTTFIAQKRLAKIVELSLSEIFRFVSTSNFWMFFCIRRTVAIHFSQLTPNFPTAAAHVDTAKGRNEAPLAISMASVSVVSFQNDRTRLTVSDSGRAGILKMWTWQPNHGESLKLAPNIS